ncbi:hypothetical protein PGT21_025304 [Puccinia graminis f. sp. tritici]|uniref:Uncharacterized protein n=1 Tax=Puccinia graminis f. sp. tritici TaxID=56615 RepID=A0A5B0PYX5_PUCGR|nr:hypothetical protein PGT21_025304 [Puccinia graminis f. sp. tritici]KAA1120959.1 hypothetical protein PGTUg99_022501 [Puccinia graminis f. sp. tritici]
MYPKCVPLNWHLWSIEALASGVARDINQLWSSLRLVDPLSLKRVPETFNKSDQHLKELKNRRLPDLDGSFYPMIFRLSLDRSTSPCCVFCVFTNWVSQHKTGRMVRVGYYRRWLAISRARYRQKTGSPDTLDQFDNR